MYRRVTAGHPASAPRIVRCRFVGMALTTQTPRGSSEQFGVGRTVWTVALGTALSAPSRDGVMLEGEWACLIGVTAHAHLLDGAEPLLRRFAGVCLVTVAALQPPLRHRVVEVQAELVGFALMALTAQDGVVELQQASRLRFVLRLRRAQASQVD